MEDHSVGGTEESSCSLAHVRLLLKTVSAQVLSFGRVYASNVEIGVKHILLRVTGLWKGLTTPPMPYPSVPNGVP
jgi:hypothetical protein